MTGPPVFSSEMFGQQAVGDVDPRLNGDTVPCPDRQTTRECRAIVDFKADVMGDVMRV